MAREAYPRNRTPGFAVQAAMKTTPEEARIARTENLFRHVNERIAEAAESFDTDQAQFVCECADANCQHRLEVPLEEYEEVRENGTHFLVAEGHRLPGFEQVVKHRRGYAIVQKVGRALAAAVRRTDPRTDSV
jgi:hypothetical protein